MDGHIPHFVDRPRLIIPRKPVGGGGAGSPMISPVSPISRQNSRPYQYIAYSSPIEAPTASAPAQFSYIPYRRPSVGRRSTNRGRRSRVSISSGSSNGGSFSNDAVSPISVADSRSGIKRPSVDDLAGTVAREVSRMQLNTESRRIPLSPLMELSAQEASFRDMSPDSHLPAPFLRSNASTVASIYQTSRQITVPRDSVFVETQHNWLPVTLRWPFMLCLFILSIVLGSITLGLTIWSQRHQGLGTVQDTAIFMFGWRFTPTIFAVIFSLLTSAMVNDVKRTEVYAKLSRPDGASVESSLFLRSRAVWLEPVDALRKTRNDGFRNWPLFWALLINLSALLIITPFSAALLSPRDVMITNESTFSKVVPTTLELTSDDTVFFRTISSVLLNTTTSAWVGNDYTVLPFWPGSNVSLPLGGRVAESNSPREWTGNTTVYQAGLKCIPMNLNGISNASLTRRLPSTSNVAIYGTVNTKSIVLASADGCTLGLSSYSPESIFATIFKSGGGWWSASPFGYPGSGESNNSTIEDLSDSHPIVMNSSAQCGDRSIFLFVSPYKQNQAFRAQGQVCKSTYYSANLPVTISTFGSSYTATFDTMRFNITKSSLDSNELDITKFERSFLSETWYSRLQAPDLTSNPLLSTRPRFDGPLVLLGAQNQFNIQRMFDNPNLVEQARQIKQRFFGESIMASLDTFSSQQKKSIDGRIAYGERRIVVSFPVGLLLTALLLLSSLKIGLVLGYTRLHERPLNLSQDPSSTSAIASLISTGQNTRALFEGLDTASQAWMRKQLARNIFYLRNGVLYSYDVRDAYQHSDTTLPPAKAYNVASSKDWQPKTLQWLLLGPLLVSYTAMIVAIAILFVNFRSSGISQSPIDPDFNLSRVNSNIIAFAPYSVIPTFLAVLLRFWWNSIDEKLRRLQPFVSMSQNRTKLSDGPRLSYVSTPIVWVVGKAVFNRHFFLALITLGTVMSEISVISLSGLWTRSHSYQLQDITLSRSADLRTIPVIFTVPSVLTPSGGSNLSSNVRGVLATVYGAMSNAWLYEATKETADNATSTPWTSDEWVFAPLNLSIAQKVSTLRMGTSTVTTNSPSLRGRLECEPVDMSNVSSWLTALDFTDKGAWNDSNIPADLEVGYELKNGLSMNQSIGNGTYRYWDADNPYFSFFPADRNHQCCGDEVDGLPGEASVGYWSPAADAEHSSVVVKWITGRPFNTTFKSSDNETHWVWKGAPKVTALRCNPVYEIASAKLTLDVDTGIVQDYTIVETPLPDPNAWSQKYKDLNVSFGAPYSSNPSGSGFQAPPGKLVHNVSVSYGYLFNDVLLNAAASASLGLTTRRNAADDVSDRTYSFHLTNLNVDIMSYSALALVHNNKSALLDPKILARTSSIVFSNYFKHFAQAPLTVDSALHTNGAWGLQSENEELPKDLGPAANLRSSVYSRSYQSPKNKTIEAVLSTSVERLQLNIGATVVSLSILGFLLCITLVVVWRHKSYLTKLPRDVDSLGSILGFVYGSERLLRTTSQEEVLDEKSQADAMITMGWFKSSGKRRWGIEVVDHRDELPHLVSRGMETEREASMDLPIHGLREASVDEGHGATDEPFAGSMPSSPATTRWY